MEPGPAHLPLLPAARAAGPALQEQPWRQVDMLLPHPPHPQAVLPHLSCRCGWGPTWQGVQVTLRKRRGDWPTLQRQEKWGGLKADLFLSY